MSPKHSEDNLNEVNGKNLGEKANVEKINVKPILKVSIELGKDRKVVLLFSESDNINEKIQKFAKIYNIKRAAILRLNEAVSKELFQNRK